MEVLPSISAAGSHVPLNQFSGGGYSFTVLMISEVFSCNSLHVLSPCRTHFSSHTKWIHLDWIYKVSMCSYSHFPKLKNLKHRYYHRRGLETIKRIGLPFSLLSHSSSLLPLLIHNSYCISCCCSLLAFSSTPAESQASPEAAIAAQKVVLQPSSVSVQTQHPKCRLCKNW